MARLIDFLVSGVPGAENGTAQFFVPGTTDPTQVWRDALAENDYPIGTANLLGLQGQLTVFATTRVRCVITSSGGAVVFDQEVDIGNDTLIDVNTAAFEDENGNRPVSLSDVLTTPKQSFGGTNWRYLAVSGEQPLNYVDVITGIHVDARAFKALGDDATDNLDSFQRAVDFCASRGGGVLFIPAGTWRIRDTFVSPHSNVSIVGAGRGATIIKCMGSGQGLALLGDYGILSRISLVGSVFSNAGYAMNVTGTGITIEDMDVGLTSGSWDGGIEIGAASDLMIRRSQFNLGVGNGIDIGDFGGAGKIRIEDCTISGGSGGSFSSIHLAGPQQGVTIKDNVLIGADYSIHVDTGFTGGKVICRDNLLTPGVQGIKYDLAANVGFEQSGNGRDYHRTEYTTTGTKFPAPAWLEQGKFTQFAVTGAISVNMLLSAPTPTPGPFIGEQPERPILNIHIHADAGATVDVSFDSAYYLHSTSMAPFASPNGNPYELVFSFAWSPERARWIEIGSIINA